MADEKKPGGDSSGSQQDEQQEQLEPVNFSPRPHDGQVSHGGEEDNHLFGPTGRPEESASFGASLGNYGFQPPPQGKAKWYGALRAAAMDPDAPDSVKDIWQLVDAMQGQSKYSTTAFGADRPAPVNQVDLLPNANGETPQTGAGAPMTDPTLPTGV